MFQRKRSATSSRQTTPTNKAPDPLKRSGSLAMTSSHKPPTIKAAVPSEPSKEIKADTDPQKTGVSKLFQREDEERLREKIQQLQEKEQLLQEKEQRLQEKETREMAREFEELALQRQQPQQMIYGAEEQQQEYKEHEAFSLKDTLSHYIHSCL